MVDYYMILCGYFSIRKYFNIWKLRVLSLRVGVIEPIRFVS